MFRSARSSLLALCAALAACADGTTRREIAAPDADPVLALTRPDGDRVFPLVLGAPPLDLPVHRPSARPVGALLVSARPVAAQVLGGARGSGDAIMTYLSSRQMYSFTARSSTTVPSAMGTIHASIVHAAYTMEVDATIDCLVRAGTEIWMSGPVTLFVFNGVARPATIHLLFKVQDNGEGTGAPPDLVSPPFGARSLACAAVPVLPMFPNGPGGRIQMLAT